MQIPNAAPPPCRSLLSFRLCCRVAEFEKCKRRAETANGAVVRWCGDCLFCLIFLFFRSKMVQLSKIICIFAIKYWLIVIT